MLQDKKLILIRVPDLSTSTALMYLQYPYQHLIVERNRSFLAQSFHFLGDLPTHLVKVLCLRIEGVLWLVTIYHCIGHFSNDFHKIRRRTDSSAFLDEIDDD